MPAHNYIFSGRMGFLPFVSAGTEQIDKLADQLPGQYANHLDWKRGGAAEKHVIEYWQPGEKVILIGHSEGVKTAVEMAIELNGTRGIEVDLLVGIDPTLNQIPYMPDNVKRTIEFHATRGLVATFRKLSRGCRGALRYKNSWRGVRSKPIVVNASHIGISKDPDVHTIIIDAVRGIV